MTQNYRKKTVKKRPDQNFMYFCISSLFSITDLQNLCVPNFMQMDLFLLYRSAILDPLFWISELRTLVKARLNILSLATSWALRCCLCCTHVIYLSAKPRLNNQELIPHKFIVTI